MIDLLQINNWFKNKRQREPATAREQSTECQHSIDLTGNHNTVPPGMTEITNNQHRLNRGLRDDEVRTLTQITCPRDRHQVKPTLPLLEDDDLETDYKQ
jgi:hypothetical protein